MELKLFNQDNIQLLKTLPDNSIDSIVTDPPYGISFMGKKWDYDVPSVETWRECLRVLKPGGHILVACGTRTQHRMAVNIEDAGFEIRDIVAWIYGSGFPKSLNIGKAVDKLQGNEREIIGSRKAHDIRGNALMEATVPEYKKEISQIDINITKGNSPYEGWGTALKPAMELWTMARKPLSEKNIAENVLKWGTGGINIDGSRVDLNGGKKTSGGCKGTDNPVNYNFGKPFKENNSIGRFPANVIHDGSDEVTDLFPNTKSGSGSFNKDDYSDNEDGATNFKRGNFVGRNDSGSASRFFYCAKASKSERNAGLDGFEEKAISDLKGNGLGRVCNLCGASQLKPCECEGNNWVLPAKSKNHHPTVKPVALMRYLVKIITPTSGMVLDPFMGSGSTGVACMKENFNFTGIELDPEYFKIAEARINNQLE